MGDALVAGGSSAARLRRLNRAAACSFVLGGALFALGAVLAQLGTSSLTTVNLTYLVGGCFFSAGGYISVVLAAADGGAGGASVARQGLLRGARDRSRAWRSAAVLFVGTLFFAVSLVAAFAAGLTPRQSDGWIWLPDITGCLCFLLSGQLALIDVGGGRVRLRTDHLDWWVAAVNQLGSVLFFLAGLAAFVRPATDEAIDAGLVNWGTFAGAVCFSVAGVLQALDTSTTTRTAGLTTP